MPVIKQPEVGDFISDLRHRLNLTQEEFAAVLGVTFATVNRWENNHSTPSRLARKQIEHLLHQRGDRVKDLLAKHLQSSTK